MQSIKKKVSGLGDVMEVLSKRDRLEVLAEEASELSQAALKLIRASRLSGNPTPVSAREAEINLEEEIADVFVALLALGYSPVMADESNMRFEAIEAEKINRWCKRLTEASAVYSPDKSKQAERPASL